MIPAHFRKALGIRPGDTVVMELGDKELRLETRGQSIARAKAIAAPYLGTRSLADELIAERRAEAAADD